MAGLIELTAMPVPQKRRRTGELPLPTIIATDFDGTLCKSRYPDIGSPNQPVIDWLVLERQKGVKIILWTMREGKLLDEAVAWCREHGLEFDAVNDNLRETQAKWGNNPRKVFADYYLDDHNL